MAGLRIQTNVPSLVAQHRLEHTKQELEHTQDKLSTGSRIIKSMDDPSGLALSEQIRATLRSTSQNIKEANNGIFLLHTADGALNYVTNMVIRMKELATAAASDTNGDKERMYLDDEVQSLKFELDRLSRATKFNGRPLLDGSGGEVSIQVGPRNVPDTDRINVATNFEVNTSTLGISSLDITSADSARESLDVLHDALDVIARVRGNIGASESALGNTIANLMQYEETLSGAYSQIRDADLAAETADLARNTILTQSGVAVLAQANQAPGVALKLLGG
jgi:flagellin